VEVQQQREVQSEWKNQKSGPLRSDAVRALGGSRFPVDTCAAIQLIEHIR
jgi:hypothetical protein